MTASQRLLVCAGAFTVLLSACSPGTSAPAEYGEVPIEELPTTVVEATDLTSTVVLHGTVVSTPQVAVPTLHSGELRRIAEAGDRVSAGEVIATVGDAEITSPASGVVASWLADDTVIVGTGITLAILSTAQLGVEVSVPVEDAYRMYSVPTEARASVESGPGGLDCTLASAPVAGEAITEAGTGVGFVCLLAPDVETMPGLTARVGIPTGTATNVMTLPVEAVDGATDSGTVTKVRDDGTYEATPVGLGITDGVRIEITQGLAQGDEVLAVVPLG